MNLLADGSLKLFFAIALVVMLTPGPAVFLAITNGVLHGVGKACFSILGNMSGFVILSGISVLGLGVIVSKWQVAFDVIK